MTTEDRIRWDRIYRERMTKALPPPDPFLLQFTPPVEQPIDTEQAPRALDLASGLGQNGIWLATQGYVVDIVDISRIALQRAQATVNAQDLRTVNILQIDLDIWEAEASFYDLVCVFRYMKRHLLPLIKLAVKPGGRVIYETFNTGYLNRVPNFNPDFLFEVGELPQFFADWRILKAEDDDHITRLAAIKPG